MKASVRIAILLAFVLSSGAAFAQYNVRLGGKNKVRYDTFEWMIYDTPHFEISYYDRVEPNLEKIASYAESSYDELARRLNFQILEPISLLAYATHAEFEQTNVILNFIPEGTGAFATPVRSRMVLPVDMSDRELQALIQHELVHIFQYEILFQGRRGRAIYRRPPLWFMEGMASYLADDETARDRAYMRDAALTDRVPSIQAPPRGFLAYRYGHMVFSYIESEYGEDGLRDFIFAFRSSFGGVEKPLLELFNLDSEEFDSRFRAWLREHYREALDRGNPSEFGRQFRAEGYRQSHQTSPVPSPAGDLVAAISTYKGDVDVVIYGVPDRRLFANLTKGYSNAYQYLIAQGLTVGPDRGRDLTFSPDGNLVAVFARTERTRSLLLLDAIRGGIEKAFEIPLPVDQAMQPAYSPDGRMIAFRGIANGQGDIYLLDLIDGTVSNLTDDEAFDTSPTFHPDGRSLVYSTQTGEYSKLIEIDLDDPTRREQLTVGQGDDEGAAFSKDGKRLYFASDREGGVFDIFGLDLENRELSRLTYVIGAAINPVPVETLDGERVGFQAFGQGRWNLYSADPNRAEIVRAAPEPQDLLDLEPYVPAVSISVDSDKAEPLSKRKLFLENAAVLAGVDQNGNFISQTYLSFSDHYGDRQLMFLIDSIDSYSNVLATFLNLEPRLQWGFQLFDYRSYLLYGYDPARGRFNDREETYRQTGGTVIGRYPFNSKYRLEGSVGFVMREATLPTVTGSGELVYAGTDEEAPFATFGAVGDTTVWNRYGPHSGSRWEAKFTYAYDTDAGGTLTRQVVLEGRKYIPLSRRNEIALRLYAAAADGNNPTIFGFGGYDTLRGFTYRSLTGNRAAFLNIEWRLPLIDQLNFSFMPVGDVRARFFIDIGAAWYDLDGREYNYLGQPGFTFIEDGVLQDGVSSYGFGITMNLFGLPVNWDFIQRWDLERSLGSREVEFWVGYRF